MPLSNLITTVRCYVLVWTLSLLAHSVSLDSCPYLQRDESTPKLPKSGHRDGLALQGTSVFEIATREESEVEAAEIMGQGLGERACSILLRESTWEHFSATEKVNSVIKDDFWL